MKPLFSTRNIHTKSAYDIYIYDAPGLASYPSPLPGGLGRYIRCQRVPRPRCERIVLGEFEP